ncbi:MAG: site-2 protease family protein [Candidatus Aenigmarchaeota archaeon]|nr:site-2 protease family protein [Candidatus Aenigmarchaeota archaeon]
MEQQEIKDLIISALVLAFVFAYSGIGNFEKLIFDFPIALLVISLGFILHELGHRQLARRFKCYAEYKLWKQGLLLAVLIAFISSGNFIFAAPGAVMIYPRADLWGRTASLSKRNAGLISIAGPIVNIILAVSFLILNFVHPLTVFGTNVFQYGALINTWLALFNLIPVPPLDGSKIFAWNLKIWGAMIAAAIMLLILV